MSKRLGFEDPTCSYWFRLSRSDWYVFIKVIQVWIRKCKPDPKKPGWQTAWAVVSDRCQRMDNCTTMPTSKAERAAKGGHMLRKPRSREVRRSVVWLPCKIVDKIKVSIAATAARIVFLSMWTIRSFVFPVFYVHLQDRKGSFNRNPSKKRTKKE